MSTVTFNSKNKKLARKIVSTAVAISLTTSFMEQAAAQETTTPSTTQNQKRSDNSLPSTKAVPQQDAKQAQAEPKQVTEAELQKYGITRGEAEQATESYAEQIKEGEKQGKISSEEANKLLSLAENEQDQSGDQEVLPAWAAAAVVGCALSVGVGEGKTQIKNALKEGSDVDTVSDIAIGAAVDCVIGAAPGGAIGAAAKKWLVTPIKAALRPLVKKVVENILKEGDGNGGAANG